MSELRPLSAWIVGGLKFGEGGLWVVWSLGKGGTVGGLKFEEGGTVGGLKFEEGGLGRLKFEEGGGELQMDPLQVSTLLKQFSHSEAFSVCRSWTSSALWR